MISSINSGGIFSSIIYCIDKNGREIELDSRTSDAVAIALRFKAPIFTFEPILEEAGIVLDDDISAKAAIQQNENDIHNTTENMSRYTQQELNNKLSKAIEEEDYELASKLRDELNKRK